MNSVTPNNIINRIQQVYVDRRTSNPMYSLRAFARDLGISQTLLTLLFQGKRRLTPKQFDKISSLLHFNPSEIHHQRESLKKNSKATDSLEKEIQHLEIEQFKLVAQWYHLPILAMASTQGFQPEPSFIAEKLGISAPEASVALERLIQLNLLTEEGYALPKASGTHARFNPSRSSVAVRSYHSSMMDKAKHELDRSDDASFRRRSIRGLSLAIDPNHLDEAKADIENFEKAFVKKFTRGKPSEVYQLNLQFFPLTTPSNPSKGSRK